MKTFNKILITTLMLAIFSTSAFGQHKLYNSLNRRMAILYKSGNITEAIFTAKDVVKIAEETFGKNHAYYAVSLENLALLYVADGSNDKAASLYEESYKVRESILGENHPNLKNVLEKLEKCYKEMQADDKIETVKARMASLKN